MITMISVTKNRQPDIHVYTPSYNHAMEALACGVSVVSLNGPALGLRSDRSRVTWEEILSLIDMANKHGSKIYLRINTILHNQDINNLGEILCQAEAAGVHGIVFSDTSLVYQKQLSKTSLPLMMATETTVTNREMIRFWYEHGVDEFLLSRELSLDEIAFLVASKPKTQGRAPCKIEIQIHGPVAIFHTLRPVLSNYHAFLRSNDGSNGVGDSASNPSLLRETALREEKRPGELYRVNEDLRGTYLYAAYDISLYPYIRDLCEMDLDSLRIDIHESQTVDTMRQIIKFYQDALCKAERQACNVDDNWQQTLEDINGFPIKHQFIKNGAPL